MRRQRIKLISLSFTVAFLFLTFSPSTSSSLVAPEAPEVSIVSTTSTTTTTTTTIPLSPEELIERARLSHGQCGEFYETAMAVGWPAEEWPKLSKIMYRESRCLPEACSQSDSGRVCRDWGLMQINDYSWKRTILSQGYEMSDMWVPEHNLTFAFWLWTTYGWQPWVMPAK